MEKFKDISSDSLRVIYKSLLKDKEKYDKNIIKLTFDVPIDKEFMEKYNKAKEIITNGKKLNKENEKLYRWYCNNLYEKSYKNERKKQKIFELKKLIENSSSISPTK